MNGIGTKEWQETQGYYQPIGSPLSQTFVQQIMENHHLQYCERGPDLQERTHCKPYVNVSISSIECMRKVGFTLYVSSVYV